MKLLTLALALAAPRCEEGAAADRRQERFVEPCRDAVIMPPGPESSLGARAEECPNSRHRVDVVGGRVLCRCAEGSGGSDG